MAKLYKYEEVSLSQAKKLIKSGYEREVNLAGIILRSVIIWSVNTAVSIMLAAILKYGGAEFGISYWFLAVFIFIAFAVALFTLIGCLKEFYKTIKTVKRYEILKNFIERL